jgi:hypothetical protein
VPLACLGNIYDPATYPALATVYLGIMRTCTSSARLQALKYEASEVNNKLEIQFCDYLPFKVQVF